MVNMLIIVRQLLKKNILHLRDLGYFNLSRLKAQRKEYWLSRLQPRTKVFDKSSQQIDLLS